jgi:hypothetical protein
MSESMGERRIDDLIHAFLDDVIDEAGRAELSAAVVADPGVARRLASMAMVHEAISRELCDARDGRRGARAIRAGSAARRWAVAAGVVIAAGALALVLVGRGSTAEAAGEELERLAQSRPDTRRTYSIRVVEEPSHRARDARREDSPGQRGRPRLAGATLHVGAPGQYVLEGTDESGAPCAVGCDGAMSWSAPAQGAVRVSDDPARFRGVLPGEQHGIAFVDPADGMPELIRSYAVESRASQEIAGRRVQVVVARRRKDASRGPREVRLWFDPQTFTIVRMSLDRLPQANGGPRSVVLDLVGEAPADPAFFRHAAHHDAGRLVLPEDSP